MATSSVTFFRSMGGTLGTAVFLSVLFNVLPGRIESAYRTSGVQLPPNAAGGDLNDTSFLGGLPDAPAHPFKVGFSEGIQVVYIMALIVMLVGLVVVFFLPEIPLAARSAPARTGPVAAEPRRPVEGRPGPAQ